MPTLYDDLSDAELVHKVLQAERDLVAARFKHSLNQLENTAKLGVLRRDIARMRTEARSRELENGLAKGQLLVVHRFTEEMVTSHQKIVADPRVQVVMVMDGFGTPSTKARQYDTLIAEQRVQYTGFKLFYRHDQPLMTPEQVLLLDPPPDLIIYQ